MTASSSPDGLLDLTRVKRSQYAALPKALAAFRVEAGERPGPALFERPPEHADTAALLGAKPVDPMLHACFSSLLNGLSSGPAQVMGLFRSEGPDKVVVRLYEPKRPQPMEPLRPVYFRVQRGHAELAVGKKWVAPGAPQWLALFAAIYYAYIGDARAFYGRKDLGGAENAAWLVLFGKDSGRADYGPADKAQAEKGRGRESGRAGSGTAGDDAELLMRVLGTAEGPFDTKLLTDSLFATEEGLAQKLAKQWQSSLSRKAFVPATGLRSGLAPAMVGKEAELRRWLGGLRGLSEDLIGLVLLFLEANQITSAKGKERYARGARTLWEGVQSALRQRIPVALELSPGDAALPELLGKNGQDGSRTSEVVDACALELPGQGKERALRYLALHAQEGPGRRFRFQDNDGVSSLIKEPHKKGAYWLELDQIMTRASRLFVGGAAIAALAPRASGPSFTVTLPGRRDGGIIWLMKS